MHPASVDWQSSALQLCVGLLWFALPFAVCCVPRWRTDRGCLGLLLGTGLIASVGGIVGGREFMLRTLALLVGWSWLVLLAFGTWYADATLRLGSRLHPMLALGALGVAGIVLPAVLLPRLAAPYAVAMGFDALLASYSYLRDRGAHQATRQTSPSLGAALFFLTVDPTLTYDKRSQPHCLPRAYAYRRMANGVGALVAYFGIIASLDVSHRLAMPTTALEVVKLALYSACHFVGLYAAHAGVASFRIGAMALIGFQTPERYNRPYLAVTPADFWRRWNIYVGDWARRYVFVPLATRLHLRLGSSRMLRGVTSLSAILCTFGLIGLLHDAAALTEPRSFHLAWTLLFASWGTVLFVWGVAGGAARRLGVGRSGFTTAFSRIALAVCLLIATLQTLQLTTGPSHPTTSQEDPRESMRAELFWCPRRNAQLLLSLGSQIFKRGASAVLLQSEQGLRTAVRQLPLARA
jgi:hypothetical protein